VEVSAALRSRRMTRSFDAQALPEGEVASLLEAALLAPTAGNCRGIGFVSLVGVDEVARYFDAATDAAWRAVSSRYEGLSRAAAVGVVVADPGTYVARYAEADKRASGLGDATAAWPVPYWFGDAGAAALAALLLAEERGWASCFLGAFRHHDELRAALLIPEELSIYGAVLLGHPDGADHRSASIDRPAPARHSLVRRGAWG
jgi:nitroreductase